MTKNDEAIARRKAEQEAERAAQKERWEARQKEVAAQKEARAKTITQIKWTMSGGTPEAFEESWPEIFKAQLIAEAESRTAFKRYIKA